MSQRYCQMEIVVRMNDEQKECVQNGKQHTNIHEIRTNWNISSTSPRGLSLMRFRRPDSVLNNHEQRPLSGDPCVMSFTCSSSLDIHTNGILYARTECPILSTCSDHLELHGRVYSGMKQFTCDTCSKSFTSASYLKVHERTHTCVKHCACDLTRFNKI